VRIEAANAIRDNMSHQPRAKCHHAVSVHASEIDEIHQSHILKDSEEDCAGWSVGQ